MISLRLVMLIVYACFLIYAIFQKRKYIKNKKKVGNALELVVTIVQNSIFASICSDNDFSRDDIVTIIGISTIMYFIFGITCIVIEKRNESK